MRPRHVRIERKCSVSSKLMLSMSAERGDGVLKLPNDGLRDVCPFAPSSSSSLASFPQAKHATWILGHSRSARRRSRSPFASSVLRLNVMTSAQDAMDARGCFRAPQRRLPTATGAWTVPLPLAAYDNLPTQRAPSVAICVSPWSSFTCHRFNRHGVRSSVRSAHKASSAMHRCSLLP